MASSPSTPPAFTGRLTDNGVPINGSRAVRVSLQQADTTELCAEASPPSVMFTDGRFSVPLPACAAATIAAHNDLFIQLTVAGAPLPPTKLGAVPYALEAAHADMATAATSATNAANASIATNATNAAVATPWQAYPVVLSCTGNGTQVVGTHTGSYRRVGDSMEVVVKSSFGTGQTPPNCVGVAQWSWSLPAGLVQDTAKQAEGTIGGLAQIVTSNVYQCATAVGGVQIFASCNGALAGLRQEGAGMYNFAEGSSVSLRATVPVLGWTDSQPKP